MATMNMAWAALEVTTQAGHGLPLGAAAEHFLAVALPSRGADWTARDFVGRMRHDGIVTNPGRPRARRQRAQIRLHRPGHLRAGDAAHLRAGLDLRRPRKPGTDDRRLPHDAAGRPGRRDGASGRRQGPRAVQPLSAQGGPGGGRRRRLHGEVLPLPIPRMDLQARRLTPSGAAEGRARGHLLRPRSPGFFDAALGTGGQLPRFRLCQSGGRRTRPRDLPRRRGVLDRQPVRPLAARRGRGRRRRVPRAAAGELEDLLREPARHDARARDARVVGRCGARAVPTAWRIALRAAHHDRQR